MNLQVLGNSSKIAQAIDAFPSGYHADFFCVRTVAREYLDCAATGPSKDTTRHLAKRLRCVLMNWGAGKKKAPKLCKEQKVTVVLLERGLHDDLVKLAHTGLACLSLHKQKRTILPGARITTVRDFDEILLSVLRRLSEGLFTNNTNVTYPMKALLLISGLMLALDSRVRAGLACAGFKGMNAKRTQYLLPSPRSAEDADAKKLTRLPFLLGHCWATFSQVLRDGIRRSGYPQLANEPGRVFDILFFRQGKTKKKLLTLCHSASEPKKKAKWYDLP